MEKLTKRPRFNPDAISLCKRCKRIAHTHVGNQTLDDPLGNLCRKCFGQGAG